MNPLIKYTLKALITIVIIWGVIFYSSFTFGKGTNSKNFDRMKAKINGEIGTLIDKKDYVQGEIIIKFKDGTLSDCGSCTFDDINKFQLLFLDQSKHFLQLMKSIGVNYISPLNTPNELKSTTTSYLNLKFNNRSRRGNSTKSNISTFNNTFVFKVSEKTDILKTCALFNKDPHVKYAHPNYILVHNAFVNDPSFNQEWGLTKIQADKAWDFAQGTGIVTAIIDSGLDITHEDILSNLWTNPGEINNNGLDDDLNGYFDDYLGWNFLGGNQYPFPDYLGHGTALAGIIAAMTNNGLGISGVAPNSKVMPIKVFNNFGQVDVGRLVQGINFAISHGADIINSSYSCTSTCPSIPALEDAIRNATNAGVVLIFSAGNNAIDMSNSVPMKMPEVITVGSSDINDNFSTFSNYGYGLSITAPGENIYTLKPGGEYVSQSGTSMSAAFVSGTAALILSQHPEFTTFDVKQVLQTTADRDPSLPLDIKYGYGRINAYKAVFVDNVLHTKIESPTENTHVSITDDFMPVYGQAYGTNFKSYEMLYASVNDFKDWKSVEGPISRQVQGSQPSNLLGTLNLIDMGLGNYYLRLVTEDLKGVKFEDKVSINITGDLLPISQVTNDTSMQYLPKTNGSQVAWIESSGAVNQLILLDTITNNKRTVATLDTNYLPYALTNDHLIYSNGNNSINLFDYDIKTGATKQISTGFLNNYSPSLDGNNLVWIGFGSNAYLSNVFQMDLTTGMINLISNPTTDQANPSISGNLIVWEDYLNGDSDIVLYNLTSNSETRLTLDPSLQLNPSISKQRVVWQDNRDGNWEIYYMDLTTGVTKRITKNVVDDTYPVIDGDYIIWQRISNIGYDLISYNIKTDETKIISNQPSQQIMSSISGGLIVWVDDRTNNFEIFTKKLFVNKEPPVISSVNDQFVRIGNTLTFSINASDPEGSKIALSVKLDSGLPIESLGANFIDNGTGTGIFTWTPSKGQKNDYFIIVTASDGELSSTDSIKISVRNKRVSRKIGLILGSQKTVILTNAVKTKKK